MSDGTGEGRAVRLADVARHAGVSQGTASNVFNRPELVREAVRERVHDSARALGYTGPDLKGRLLRAGRFNAIGVATAEPLSYFFEDPFARVLMQGMAETCDEQGAGLALVSARNDEKLAWNIQSALVDGFVLLCIDNGEELVRLTRERQLPFIALALGNDDPTVSVIGVDDREGGRMAARHLLGLGHRRLGIISLELTDGHQGPVDAEIEAAIYSTSRDRALGFFEVAAEAGIPRQAIPVYEAHSTQGDIDASLDWLFDRPEPPTAIFAMSDRTALFALDWFARRGLDVPGDVSLIGFDGVPDAALCQPPLTTIAQPIAEIGRRAVKAILDGKAAGKVIHDVLPLDLVVRATTGPAKG